MALQSMTGFARVAAERKGVALAWEAKSVNGKGVDARLRLPPGYERLELPARQAIQKSFARGNIQAALTVSGKAVQSQPVVNEAFLREIARLSKKLQEEFGVAPASADGLLGLRGVLETPEISETEEERADFDRDALASLDAVLSQLESARRTEGAALGALLAGQLDRIESLTKLAEADPSRSAEAIRAKLAEQVRLLLESSVALDESRLMSEAVLLATKADIREEIDRLKTHLSNARSLLSTGGPVGRKLDFLAQEFNRESNTLCSKANASTVTAIGLELKVVVDQFREQVQNLE